MSEKTRETLWWAKAFALWLTLLVFGTCALAIVGAYVALITLVLGSAYALLLEYSSDTKDITTTSKHQLLSAPSARGVPLAITATSYPNKTISDTPAFRRNA